MKEVKDYNPSKDPRLIDCKTECGNDKCYARRYNLFAEKTCPNFVEPKPITNADRIRAMTDEELAKWLSCPGRKEDMFPNLEIYIAPNADEWLDWLREKEEDNECDCKEIFENTADCPCDNCEKMKE